MITFLHLQLLILVAIPYYVVATFPRLTTLNVKCDKNGMNVHIEFDLPFNGIVYSKGHYNNPSCRYITPGRSSTYYDFLIPLSGCGTSRNDQRDKGGHFSLSNIIIFQNDENFQEVWDRAQSLRCEWTNNIDKFINVQPIGVDTLDIQELIFSGDQVDCWMEVQLGKGPFAPSVNRLVKIGEVVTLAIFVKDDENVFDITVKSCYAFDLPDFNSPQTRRIQLTDPDGCPVKTKIVDGFYRTKQTGTSGASVIAYAYISAFKFPDKSEVYMACNVNICKRGCHSSCLQEVASETHIKYVLPNATSTSNKVSVSRSGDIRIQSKTNRRSFRPKNPTNGHTTRIRRSTNLDYIGTNLKRSFNIFSPDDLPHLEPIYLYDHNYNSNHDVCMSIYSFALNSAITILLLLICCYLTFHVYYQIRHKSHSPEPFCKYLFMPCFSKNDETNFSKK